MLKRFGIGFLLMALVLLPLSCTRMEGPGEGSVAIEKLPDAKSIPMKWGKLVQVSHRPEQEGRYQMWFQDDEGNFRIVTFNMRTNRLAPNARLIPQK